MTIITPMDWFVAGFYFTSGAAVAYALVYMALYMVGFVAGLLVLAVRGGERE